MMKIQLALSCACCCLCLGAMSEPSLAGRTKYLRDADRAAHEETIRTIRDLQHGDFYTVDWSTNADYRLDEMVAAGKKGSFAFEYYSVTNLLKEGTPFPGVAGIKFGCSAFAVTNAANDSLVGRSFDYSLPMARVLLHVPRAENRYASVGMVDAGWLNYSSGELDLVHGTNDLSYVALFPYECMDGMNEKGLTVSILALDAHSNPMGGTWVSEQYEPCHTNITLALAIRYLLDRADSTETAVNMLSNFNCFASTGLEELVPGYAGSMEMNYHYFIGDRSGDSRVVEWVRPEKPGDSWRLFAKKAGEVTNFYLYDGYGHGSNRWEVLSHALRHRGYKLEEDEAMSLLHGVRQQSGVRATSFTQWSVVYNLDRATARIATLGHYTNHFDVALNADWSAMDVRSKFYGITPLSVTSDVPTDNPAAYARDPDQAAAVRTLRDLDSGRLWKMRSAADCRRSALMADAASRATETGIIGFVTTNLLADGAKAPVLDAPVFGAAALIADGTLARLGCGAGETNAVVLSLKAPDAAFASVNVVNAARFPDFAAGAFTNGVTDLSWTAAFPYFAEAGMNAGGLAAALVATELGATFAPGAEPLAPGLALRLVLDTYDTVAAATNALAAWRLSDADGAVGLMLADATGATAVFPADAVRARGDVGAFVAAQSDLRKTGYEPDETIDILSTVADAATRCAMSFEPKTRTFSVAPGTSWRLRYATAELMPVAILAEPTWVPNTSAAVYTNGVLSAETEEGSGQWHAWSNETATVVYTADDEFAFYDGSTVKTNALDTTQDPAVNAEFPGLTEPFMSPADAQAELGVEYGRNHRDIWNVAYRTADEKVVAARQLEQVYADAREAVYAAPETHVASTCRNGVALMRRVVYELAQSVHSELRQITNYFHEVTFTDYSPCFINDVLGDFRNPILPNLEDLLPDFRTFGCSGCVKDGLVGRNFDWTFGITDEYLVRTERNERHYASIGISAPGALLAMDEAGLVDLSGGNYTNAIPYTTVDGVNEFGIHVSAYVVPGKDVGFTTNTNPQATETIPQIAFVRYALDRAASFAEVTNLAATANIYSSLTFELHFFVTDGKDSCVIEFVGNKVVFVPYQTKITNYYLSQRLKDSKNPYTPNSMGIERYQDLERMLPDVTDKASMLAMMTNLNYSTTYTGDPKSRWSELNGFDNDDWSVKRILLTPRSFYHGDTNDYTEAAEDRTNTFARLKVSYHTDWTNYLATGQLGKDPKIWVTSHAAVYDLANRSIDMHFLEGRETYSFRLSDAWNIGATDDDTVTAWTNATGVLFIDGVGKMRGFGSDGTGLPWSPSSVTAVVISDGVTNIGTNAWYGLADSVTYNGLSSAAARTLIDGFGGSLGYARTPFKDIQVGGGIVQLAVALEKTPSLTNEWTEVKLQSKDVEVDANGHIVITHETGDGAQGFYIMQPTK